MKMWTELVCKRKEFLKPVRKKKFKSLSTVWKFSWFFFFFSSGSFFEFNWLDKKQEIFFQLLLGSATGNLRLYDAITKQMLQDITCTHPLVSHIACSPKGNQFATSCLSSSSQVPSTNQSAFLGRLELWNLTGNSVRTFFYRFSFCSSHYIVLELQAQLSSTLVDSKISGNIQSLAFHPKSDTLVCGGSTGDITIFG